MGGWVGGWVRRGGCVRRGPISSLSPHLPPSPPTLTPPHQTNRRLDIDWEYPGVKARGGNATSDAPGLAALAAAFKARAAATGKNYMLTMAVPGGPSDAIGVCAVGGGGGRGTAAGQVPTLAPAASPHAHKTHSHPTPMPSLICEGFNLPALIPNVDYFTIMAYDFHGSW